MDNTGAYDSAAALAVMPDGQLLAAGYSASNNCHAEARLVDRRHNYCD